MKCLNTGAHSEPHQKPKIDRLAKIVNSFQSMQMFDGVLNILLKNTYFIEPQSAFTCLKLTIEILALGVKSVQS